MPTEQAFLFAGLLFMAAALGYVFAWFGEKDRDDADKPPVNRDYLKGVHFLLDEDADSALEVFARMAETDEDTLEIHFALGSLFRKRGEVDRAIRIHQNIMARPNLDRAQKGQAQIALAEDYLSAGLLDRAESLFSQLRENPELRSRALRRLLGILEQTRDWEAAIEVHDELARLEPGAENIGRLAHYYCELAEQAIAGKDLPRARAMLKKADGARPRTVRAMLVRADLARESGDWREAAKLCRRVADRQPGLITDIVPRVAAVYRARENEEAFGGWLQRLLDAQPDATAAVAMAVIADPLLQDPVALDALEEFVAADPILQQLVDVDHLRAREGEERLAALQHLRNSLRQVLSGAAAYRCQNCGYGSLALQWQCPGCRAWETVRPELQVALGNKL